MSTPTVGERAEEQVRISVRALRSARGVSAKAICERLGLSRAAYFTRMNGATSFSAGEVAELADLLATPISAIYTGQLDLGPQPPEPSVPFRAGPGTPGSDVGTTESTMRR